MSANDPFAECGRAVARVVRDPLSPSPILELAQYALVLKQRVDALEANQRAFEERIVRLEKGGQER